MNDEHKRIVWQRLRQQGKSHLQKAIDELAHKHAVRIDNEILGQIVTGTTSGKLSGVTGTLFSEDLKFTWDERRTVFINGNTYNINRKILTL